MSRQPSSQSSSSISTDPNRVDQNGVVEFDEAEFARRLAGEWSNGERLSIAHSVNEYLTERAAQGAPVSGQTLPPETHGDTARAKVADTARGHTPASGSTPDASPEVVWSRLQAELRDFAEQEAATWGGVDECLLARYLAGECTDEEWRQVEHAKHHHPAVRECLELVQEVMADEEINALPIVNLDASKVRRKDAELDLPRFLRTKIAASSVAPATTPTAAPRRSFSSWVAAAALLLALGSTWLHFAEKMASQKPEMGVAAYNSRLMAQEEHLAKLIEKLGEAQQNHVATRSVPQQQVTMAQAINDGKLVETSLPEKTDPMKPNNSKTAPIHVAESVRGQRITGEISGIAGCAPGYGASAVVTVYKANEEQAVNEPKPSLTAANRLSAFRLEMAPLSESDELPLLPLPELVDAARAWQGKDSPFLPLVAKALRKELGDPTQWPQELIDAILALEKDPSKAAAFVLTGKIDLKGATELSAVVDRFKNSDKPELRAAAIALAGEIDSKETIELSAVIDGLKSRNKLERWAAVAALSETWRSSCGVFVVAPQDVPQGTTLNDPHKSLPSTQHAQTFLPVPDQRFAQANEAMKATPTLTVFKPVFESLTPLPTRSSPAPKQKLLADGMREDQPSSGSFPRTYSPLQNPAPRHEYDEPATSAPRAIQPYELGRQHPLAANADELVPQLMKLLDSTEDEDPLVRRTALHVIADFRAKALPARQSLERILKDDAEAVSRRWAAYAIGRIGPDARESFGILVGCLIAEKDASVLTAVCFAISELARGEKPLLDGERKLASMPLSSLLADHSDPQVRRWAAFAFNSVNRPQQAQGDAPPNYVPRTTSFPLKGNMTARHTSDASDSSDGTRGR